MQVFGVTQIAIGNDRNQSAVEVGNGYGMIQSVFKR